jgi:TAG lipase / steryl ester hydrolase / phospholipase A2 / LPA acyltransferase
VQASCALPGFFPSASLMAKAKDGSIHPYYMTSLRGNFTFIDGSVSNDIPVERMSELFNINTYIVSQVNPHFIPFISSDA